LTYKVVQLNILKMKKAFIIGFSCIALFACSTNSNKKDAATKEVKIGNLPIDTLVNNYMQLKEAFVQDSAELVQVKIAALNQSINTQGAQLQTGVADSVKRALRDLTGLLESMLAEKDIENNRTTFKMMTAPFTTLMSIKGAPKVYQQHCPMAFNDEGGSWLSYETKIANPYLPKQMLRCGVVQDNNLSKLVA
jgi:hypothetical protein